MKNKFFMSKNKYISSILIILTFLYVLLGLYNVDSNGVLAAYYSDDINGINETLYPGYKTLITNLQNEYSNWSFKLYYTGLDWNEVIISETQGHKHSPKSLFNYGASYKGEWYCPVCGKREFGSNWHCASEKAVEYMMDPRNSINKSDIFQFQDISNPQSITTEQIATMVAGTFLNTPELVTAIYNVAVQNNINPFFIAARIIQEQGAGTSTLSSGQGYNGNYVGYYNIFNIGASGSSDEEIILNGLSYAVNKGWDTLEKSIYGGIATIAENYIPNGQNTQYFQKFDVVGDTLYNNQYMQNILAAQNEGTKMRKAYENIGKVNGTYTFIIPIYENMPIACSRPNAGIEFVAPNYDIATLNVNTTLAVRAMPKSSARLLANVKAGTTITILRRASEKVDGYYWDRVIADSGASGYMARESTTGDKVYLQVQSTGTDTTTYTNEPVKEVITHNKIEVTGNIIKTEPETTLEIILKNYPNATVVDKNGVAITEPTANVGTGAIVTDGQAQYTIKKMGDLNGDGKSNTIDALMSLKHDVGSYTLTDVYLEAMDVNKDGIFNTVDALIILKHDVGIANITI